MFFILINNFWRIDMENIIEHYKKIKSIKSVEELKNLYTIEELERLIKKNKELEDKNNILFSKTIEQANKEDFKKLWVTQKNLHEFSIILTKALNTIEKDMILTQATEVAEKLESIINEIDRT